VPTSTTTVDRITPRSKVVILPTRERPLAA